MIDRSQKLSIARQAELLGFSRGNVTEGRSCDCRSPTISPINDPRTNATGMILVNHPTTVEADLPFGGIQRSGYRRELLGLGLKDKIKQKLNTIIDVDARV